MINIIRKNLIEIIIQFIENLTISRIYVLEPFGPKRDEQDGEEELRSFNGFSNFIVLSNNFLYLKIGPARKTERREE